MTNLATSAPPTIEYTAVPPSTSLLVTVVTALVFSATLTDAVVPPPLLVITGASLTAVTAMSRVASTLFAAPSLATNATVRVAVFGASLVLK